MRDTRVVLGAPLSIAALSVPCLAGPPPFPSFQLYVVDNAAVGVRGASAADVDHDGDVDFLAAIGDMGQFAWYENDGATPVPGWTKRIIDGQRYAVAIHAYGGAVTNSGTRIIMEVYNNMAAWKA